MMKARRSMLLALAVPMVLILATAAEAATYKTTVKGKEIVTYGSLAPWIGDGDTIEVAIVVKEPPGDVTVTIKNLTTTFPIKKVTCKHGVYDDAKPVAVVEGCVVLPPPPPPPGVIGPVSVAIHFTPTAKHFFIAVGCKPSFVDCTSVSMIDLDKITTAP